jgi:hypothetical protein
VVFDLLVGGDSSDEQKIHEAVVENVLEHPMRWRVREAFGVHRYRQHPCVREPQLLEFLAVVFRIAERQVRCRR